MGLPDAWPFTGGAFDEDALYHVSFPPKKHNAGDPGEMVCSECARPLAAAPGDRSAVLPGTHWQCGDVDA